MKTKLFLIAALTLATACLSGCSDKVVSNQTLEDARAQSYANGVLVAQAYVRESPRLKGMTIVGHADEHQTAECPQGSGWTYPSALRNTLDAEGKVIAVEKVKLVCSTVSAHLGCYREQDFKETAFNDKAGKCDTKLPFPLPKLVGKT